MLSFGMKYPEKRKKAPRTVQMRELPEMKSGDTALKKSTKELAMSTMSQTTKVKKVKAEREGFSPTSQYTGTAKSIDTTNKNGSKTKVLAIM